MTSLLQRERLDFLLDRLAKDKPLPLGLNQKNDEPLPPVSTKKNDWLSTVRWLWIKRWLSSNWLSSKHWLSSSWLSSERWLSIKRRSLSKRSSRALIPYLITSSYLIPL